MGIIDDQQIGTATGDRASNTCCEVLPAMVRGLSTRSLAVCLQAHAVEDVLVLGRVEKVPDLTAKVNSQLGSMGGLNDLGLRITANDP